MIDPNTALTLVLQFSDWEPVMVVIRVVPLILDLVDILGDFLPQKARKLVLLLRVAKALIVNADAPD